MIDALEMVHFCDESRRRAAEAAPWRNPDRTRQLDAAALDRALRLQQESGGERLGQLLVTLGLCAQRDVTEALAQQLGLPLVDATGYPEFPILEEQVSPRFLRESAPCRCARTSPSWRSRWPIPPTPTRSVRSRW